jgi:hypothetical protein
MNIICQYLYYQYILDKFHFFKSPKIFRVIITIILCCPCYMPKYVPRLECLLTLGHISAYKIDNTLLLYNYILDLHVFVSFYRNLDHNEIENLPKDVFNNAGNIQFLWVIYIYISRGTVALVVLIFASVNWINIHCS